MTRGRALATIGAAAAVLVAAVLLRPRPDGPPETRAPAPVPPSLVLLTLDTTRADALGAYGSPSADTPALDALARRGTRWSRALAPAPLTLPSHASLMTGLDPPEHGLRDNGTASLPPDLPTLAGVLADRGYDTAAFVSSRVLDRRFGLDRGFAHYDDRIVAERLGEYGYPERDAAAVTGEALRWLATAREPFFLWIHYYDPHLPYTPPGAGPAATLADLYAGEVSFMDGQIGRLLAALPGDPAGTLVAAVGDHGEMLGEHGEAGHGIFLYRSAVEVPLLVAGPGTAAGAAIGGPAPIRGVAATLLDRLGLGDLAAAFGPPLPTSEGGAGPVYAESRLPATAYGWSPLTSLTEGRWRFIAAPRPELYDFVADPAEENDLSGERTDVARRLARALAARIREMPVRQAGAVAPDPALREQLRSLGYLSGATGDEVSGLDPKDGIRLLEDFDRAKAWLDAGRPDGALPILERLAEASPGNVPFLTALGRARFVAGRPERAVAAYRRAAELNPGLDFVHLNLGDALLETDRAEEARAAFRRALELNPRLARAWLRLAEIELRAGRAEAARRLLRDGAAAGTHSAGLLTRLAELEIAAGELDTADDHLARAVAILPQWAPAWLRWGELAERRGETGVAAERYAAAARAAPGTPAAAAARARLAALPAGPGRVADPL